MPTFLGLYIGDVRLGRECRELAHQENFGVISRVNRLPRKLQLALGLVPDATHTKDLTLRPHLADDELVLSNGARLIYGDNSSLPKGLYRLESLHKRMTLRHAPH